MIVINRKSSSAQPPVACVTLLALEGVGAVCRNDAVLLESRARPGRSMPSFFFVPDLSMLAYLAGPRIGAGVYNLVHATIAPLLLAHRRLIATADADALARSRWSGSPISASTARSATA